VQPLDEILEIPEAQTLLGAKKEDVETAEPEMRIVDDVIEVDDKKTDEEESNGED
jgi:hypothetical protein